MQLLNFDNSLNYLRKEIYKRDGKITSYSKYINQKRYALLKCNNDLYFALFKRNFFNSFGEMFPEEKGKGESINLDALKFCFSMDVRKIFFVYENGNIYNISPQDIVIMGHKRQIFSESKEVYSFSIKHLRRYNG
jgi:hypothetical protein